MDGRTVLGFLKRMCRDIDEGRPVRRITWGARLASATMPVVLGLTVGVASCECEDPGAVDLYGAPMRVGDAGPQERTTTDASPPTLPEPADDGGPQGSDGAPLSSDAAAKAVVSPPPVPTFDAGRPGRLKLPSMPALIKVPGNAGDPGEPVVVYGRPFPDGPQEGPTKFTPSPDDDTQP